MAEGSSRKRGFPGEDFDSGKEPPQKRVRFPKGKKVKFGDYVVEEREEGPIPPLKPQRAAEERRKLRSQLVEGLIEDERSGLLPDITKAEAQYEGSETFEDDGIQIEPFNLTKEREEGYFDESGNYVEYINENEIKDAWFDGVEANKNYAARGAPKPVFEVKGGDLSSNEIGKMKRRIADSLESGETVLQALKRLKGNSTDRKAKMSAETKEIFDQLTEDAMRLMENGEYNVYDEEQETFQREAEGYEKLAEDFDMFGDDDDKPTEVPVSNRVDQPSGDQQDDYVYDDSTGYYYSSRLGYYYDPASGLYCNAASGQWFSYNAESGTYDEVQQSTAPSVSEPAASSAEYVAMSSKLDITP